MQDLDATIHCSFKSVAAGVGTQYVMLYKVSQLARHSCYSSGCTFPKWGNQGQSSLPKLSEQIILQCHFKWGCFVSFHSRKSQLCPSFSSFDLCQMLPSLCIFSTVQAVQLIKNAAFCSLWAPLTTLTDSVLRCLAMIETKQKQVFWFLTTCERKGGGEDDDVSDRGWVASSLGPWPLSLRHWKHSVKFLSGKTTVV